jgi:hypothetical protein
VDLGAAAMNALLRHKLTPRSTRQKWVRITVEDAARLLEMVEWREEMVRLLAAREGDRA